MLPRLWEKFKTAPEHPRGFALIATVSLLVLVALVVMGLVSLSTLSLLGGQRAKDQATAQSNARLALMMAMGQLQKELGPDQRVSARADLLNKSQNYQQPLWVGAWRADGLKNAPTDNSQPLLYRQASDGSWLDRRIQPATGNPAVQPKDEVMRWLVTSGANATPAPETYNDALGIEIQSALKNLSGQEVKAVRVPKLAVSARAGNAGALGWWTDDESQKANILMDNRHQPEELAARADTVKVAGPYGLSLQRQAAFDPLTSEHIPKLASLDSVSVAVGSRGIGFKASPDYTTMSEGLLTNVRDGGLREDLAAFGASAWDLVPWSGYAAVTGDTPLIDQALYRTLSPRFGIIRDWCRLQNEVQESGNEAKIAVHAPASMLKPMSTVLTKDTPYERFSLSGTPVIDIEHFTKAPLHPVMVRTEMTVIPCIQEGAIPVLGSQATIAFKVLPVVVLWNPYNVTIRSAPYSVRLHYPYRFKLRFEGTAESTSSDKTMDVNFDLMSSGSLASKISSWANPPYAPLFQIAPTEFKPGESLAFLPESTVTWNSGSSPANLRLSATAPVDPPNFFRITDPSIVQWPDNATRNKIVIRNAAPVFRMDYNRWRCNSTSGQSAAGAGTIGKQKLSMLFAGAANNWTAAHTASNTLLQSLNTCEDWHMSSDALVDTLQSSQLRSIDENVFPQQGRCSNTITGMGMNTASDSDFRDANKPWSCAPVAVLSNYNIRGNTFTGNPGELYSRSVTGRHTYAPFRDTYYDLPYGPGMMPFAGNEGKNYYSPMGSSNLWSGVDRYVLFDVPRPSLGIHSIGSLQHVAFSPHWFHPTYAVGNSDADLRPEQTRTSFETAIMTGVAAWRDMILHPGVQVDENIYFSLGQNATSAANRMMHCDLSFELNQALWDRYYFSGLSYQNTNNIVRGTFTGPNYRVDGKEVDALASFSDMNRGYHEAAKYLSVPGSFNVNSTSVEAWTAFLSASVMRSGGYKGDSAGRAAFPRFLDGPGGRCQTGDTLQSPNVWSGFRSLDPAETKQLAEAIVREVKARGPFLSLSDFINRRLAKDDTGKMGALQTAIDTSGLNSFLENDTLDNYQSLYDQAKAGTITNAKLSMPAGRFCPTTWKNLKAWPKTRARHAPGFLAQGDILQSLGGRMTVRGDTFRIRAYGEARDASGKITSRAWLEATVQRTVEPVFSQWDGIKTEPVALPQRMGRRFQVVSSRWLSPAEV